MMKRIFRTGVLGITLVLCMAVSANGEMRVQKENDVIFKKPVKLIPDLIVEQIRLSAKPKEGETMGAPAFFSIVIKNTSAGLARESTIRLQCTLENSRLQQCPGELTGVLSVPVISGEKSLTLQWPKPSRSLWVAGDYTLSVEVDYQNKVQETNEKNNKQTYRFSIAKSQATLLKPHNETGISDLPIKMGQAKDQRGKDAQIAIPGSHQENFTAGNRLKFEEKSSLPIMLNTSPETALKAKIAEEAVCREYAQEAVDQYAQSETNLCGFQGSGWDNDFSKHYNWCISASQDQRNQESENRKKALKTCGEIKRFDNPRYLGLLADFCMYRRTETHSSTPIEGELYDYDFGWTCGVPEVAESYCISQGYDEMVEFMVADDKASENTMPLGNHHRCEARIPLSNCRGFDYIICRKPVAGEPIAKLKAIPQGVLAGNQPSMVSLETVEAVCQDYAETAVQQYHDVNNSWCSLTYAFEPGRWHGNVKVHYDWCLTASPSQRQAENEERLRRLGVCAEKERQRFYSPMFNGKRVDINVNFHKKYDAGEPDVPQRAADLFCQEMGYETAIPEWSKYNNTFSTESLDNTIHMGEGHPECNTDWPSFNDKCEAFSHITCERPAQP